MYRQFDSPATVVGHYAKGSFCPRIATSRRFRGNYLHKNSGENQRKYDVGRSPWEVAGRRRSGEVSRYALVGASRPVLRSTFARPHKPLTRPEGGCLACRQKTPTSKE